jgi:hypothetical protein
MINSLLSSVVKRRKKVAGKYSPGILTNVAEHVTLHDLFTILLIVVTLVVIFLV